MSEELESVVPATSETENETLENEPESPKGESVEELKAKLEAEAKAKAQILARAKKAEEALKKNKPTQPDEDIRETVSKLELAETKRQYGYENNLSPAEVDAIFKINSNPTKETLNDPFVKGGLEAIRASKRLEENTPRTRSSAGRITPKSDKPLTPEQKQKEFEARRDEILATRRGR